jgi:hypothetical protein
MEIHSLPDEHTRNQQYAKDNTISTRKNPQILFERKYTDFILRKHSEFGLPVQGRYRIHNVAGGCTSYRTGQS